MSSVKTSGIRSKVSIELDPEVFRPLVRRLLRRELFAHMPNGDVCFAREDGLIAAAESDVGIHLVVLSSMGSWEMIEEGLTPLIHAMARYHLSDYSYLGKETCDAALTSILKLDFTYLARNMFQRQRRMKNG